MSLPLPQGFRERILAQFDDGEELLNAISRGMPVHGLRVNPAKPADLPYATQAIAWEPNGFAYDAMRYRPGTDALHAAGAYYLQEPSAMAAAPLLGAKPSETVLDLCASPGGKSGQLAAAMRGKGLLVSNETHPGRAAILAQNLERLGVANALVLCARPDQLADRFPAAFDRILVDAPCSGEGMFRRDEEARAQWSPDAPRRCAIRQALILESAAVLLRPGGYMVYSTCTFNREENEDTVEAFLRRHPSFAPLETRRILPHLHAGEGHFAALLKRNGGGERQPLPTLATDESMRPAWLAFAAQNLADGALAALPLLRFGDNLYAPPPLCPPLGGLHVVRAGVQLAFLRKDRVEPAHALAMSLRREQAARSVDLNEEDATRYLCGHPLSLNAPTGWTLVCYRNLPLGWGKVSDGQLKNHLPKGLRRQR